MMFCDMCYQLYILLRLRDSLVMKWMGWHTYNEATVNYLTKLNIIGVLNEKTFYQYKSWY